MDVLDRIDTVLDEFVTWDGVSDDAADSEADDHLDRSYPCANCGWEDAGHDDDDCPFGYLPDLPAEETGEYAIIDWFDYQATDTCRFSDEGEADEPIWVLAAYCLKPGHEEGELQPRCEPTTVAECRKLAKAMGCGVLVGD